MKSIVFADDLQKICEDTKIARRKLGDVGAKKLRTRLGDLIAAANVGEVVAGRPHPLQGDREGQLALDLDGGRRLVLESTEDPVPLNAEGRVDWSKVTRIKIVFIGDYHD